MSLRSLRVPALLCSLAVAACDVGSRILGEAGSSDQATVRFVNASASSLDLANGGVVTAGNGGIAPGAGVGCFAVSDLLTPGITIRETGTTTNLADFSLRFAPGAHYTLVGFPGTSGGIQFATVLTATQPDAGRSAVRVFNGTPTITTVDVYVTAPGAALGSPSATGVLFGTASGSFDVAAGTSQVRLVSVGPVVTDLGNFVLAPDRSYTIISSSGTAPILVPDC